MTTATVTRQKLGDVLKETMHLEKNRDRELERLRLSRESAEEQAKTKHIEDLFDGARAFFTQGILDQVPTKDLQYLVGHDGSKSQHSEAERLLHMKTLQSSKAPRGVPASVKYAPLWDDFQKWAPEEGLSAYFQYCWAGGGMYSWHVLRIEPYAPKAR
ncbi:hypothetical protein LC612_36180 [Nostoc sp. CHAB 5834]|nr:hypothetical protein [Nostoc sp. CHAB 5834]